jgi:hypothetical protein
MFCLTTDLAPTTAPLRIANSRKIHTRAPIQIAPETLSAHLFINSTTSKNTVVMICYEAPWGNYGMISYYDAIGNIELSLRTQVAKSTYVHARRPALAILHVQAETAHRRPLTDYDTPRSINSTTRLNGLVYLSRLLAKPVILRFRDRARCELD